MKNIYIFNYNKNKCLRKKYTYMWKIQLLIVSFKSVKNVKSRV